MTSYFSFGGLELLRSCRVAGCKVCKPGNTHYCDFCKITDVTHRSRDCPKRADKSSMCRVAGCKVCKPGNSHYCRCCGEKDSTHRACECPTNLKET